MGVFDTFYNDSKIVCPVCGNIIKSVQTKKISCLVICNWCSVIGFGNS